MDKVIVGLLLLSSAYVLVQMTISHMTHSLTLSVDSYHTLYNMFNLLATLISIKMSQNPRLTRYTFGCYRVEVLGVAMSMVFLLGLLFSTFVTGLQTLVHVSHEDAMHYPFIVMIVGGIGLTINLIAIIFIGGFSHHQTGFLSNKNAGNPRATGNFRHEWPSLHSFLRDTHGCLLVVVCAIFVYFTNESFGKFVDPIIAIVSLFIMIAMSTGRMKGTMSILLQTLPNEIDFAALKIGLREKFPCIENVHEFHIWCLTPGSRVASMHIRFQNPEVYMKVANDVEQFFRDQNINNVTIQPEFDNDIQPDGISRSSTTCLLPCLEKDCESRQCCNECAEFFCYERSRFSDSSDTNELKSARIEIQSSEDEKEELLPDEANDRRKSGASEDFGDMVPQLEQNLSNLKESCV